MPPTRSDPNRDDAPDPRAVSALDALRGPPAYASTGLRERAAILRSSLGALLAGERLTTRVLVLGLGVVTVVSGIGAVLYVRTAGAGSSPELPFTATTTIPMTTAPAPTTAMIVVHAAGAVRAPGVYRLPTGSRVVDLLDLAGGPADDIDLDRVNLAAALTDGERVFVPRVGSSPPVAVGPEGGTASGAAGATGPVDLNHATATQLEALPGVGPATAAAIIAHREQTGPFRSVDDLLSVRGIGAAKLDAIRDLVIAG